MAAFATDLAARAATAAFSPNGGLIAIGEDNEVELREVATTRLRHTLVGHTKKVVSLAFSPDGRTLASGSWDTTARLWEVQSGRLLQVLPGRAPYSGFEPLSWSPAVGGLHALPAIFRSSPGGRVQLANSGTFPSSVVSLAFSPNGASLVTGATFYSALWDTARGRKRRYLDQSYRVDAVAYSPDGRLVASGTSSTPWEGRLRLWEPRSGRLLTDVGSQHGGIAQLGFSPSGELLASCGEDTTVRLWRVPKMTVAHALTGPTGSVNSIAFGPAGRLLAAGSADGSVRIWEVASGRTVLTLHILNHGRDWLAVDTEGHYDCSAGAESLLAWRVGDEVFSSRELTAERRRPGMLARIGAGARG
jgi:WD40 repeat protein